MLPEISLPIFRIVDFSQNLGFPASDALPNRVAAPELTQDMDVIWHDRGGKEGAAVALLVPSR